MGNQLSMLPPEPSRVFDVLLIEDNPGDQLLTKKAFVRANIPHALHIASTGEEALAFLKNSVADPTAPKADIVLLDLNLPDMSGRDVLYWIKTNPRVMMTPVVVLTSSQIETDIVEAYTRHANAYMVKPDMLSLLAPMIQSFGDYWFNNVRFAPR